MAHLTGISSDIFDMNQSDDASSVGDSQASGEGTMSLSYNILYRLYQSFELYTLIINIWFIFVHQIRCDVHHR